MNDKSFDFSLSTNNLKEIPFQKYAKDFDFIVNGKKYQTNRFVADILSPIIRKMHFADESIDEFYINIDHFTQNKIFDIAEQTFEDDFFDDFLSLATFRNNKIDYKHQKIYAEYFSILGNIDEFFKIQPDFFTSLTTNNIIDRLLSIIQIISHISEDFNQKTVPINEIIDFIACNFESIDKEQIKKLPVEILEDILGNENLELKDEDSLLHYILQLYENDRSYFRLFEYVIFVNVSENALQSFIDKFEIGYINDRIWRSICDRLLTSKKNSSNIKSRFNKSKIKNRYHKIISDFKHHPEKEFEGIMQYLTAQTHGNIHDNGTIEVTSNSINNNNPRYHPKNLVDYQNNNYYHSSNEGDAIISFDFKDKLVKLSSYSIKSYSTGSNSDHLRNWVIEVSKNGENWIEVDLHTNDPKLNGANITATFNVNKQDDDYYRFIRLRQTGFSWYNYPYNNNYYFVVYQIEFYGQLLQTSIK